MDMWSTHTTDGIECSVAINVLNILTPSLSVIIVVKSIHWLNIYKARPCIQHTVEVWNWDFKSWSRNIGTRLHSDVGDLGSSSSTFDVKNS